MVMAAITSAEEGIYAVLGTMGVVVPPDPDDLEAPSAPGPEMDSAPMYPAAKSIYEAAGLREWLGARNEH